jgi:ABC-2 type transport system permease protein
VPQEENVSQFFGILRHEFSMSLRRTGMWIAYLLLYSLYLTVFFVPDVDGFTTSIPTNELWKFAGQILFYCNMFMTVLAGILAADRLQRDFRLGVRELQQSAPLSLPVYILSKYCGVLFAALTPMLIFVLIVGFISVFVFGAPLQFFGNLLVAFFAMGVPAHAFVVAFSLACPLVMPVRVYQVLFTGYWFWGNYLNPGAFPTISETLLVPSGKYVLEGFFGGFPSDNTFFPPYYTATDAILNLSVLAACVVLVLFSLNYYLRWQARRA